jgi:cell division protein FtsB
MLVLVAIRAGSQADLIRMGVIDPVIAGSALRAGGRTRRILAVKRPLLHPASMALLVERLVPVGMLVIAAVSVPVMLWSASGLPRLDALRGQRENLNLELTRLEREIERLRIQADSIKSSPSSIEGVARDKLGLVRSTELVVQFKSQ